MDSSDYAQLTHKTRKSSLKVLHKRKLIYWLQAMVSNLLCTGEFAPGIAWQFDFNSLSFIWILSSWQTDMVQSSAWHSAEVQ